jgi:hypothetical protein
MEKVIMRQIFMFLFCVGFFSTELPAVGIESSIMLTPEECLFVTCKVPERGIVCSNHSRVLRLSKLLENRQEFQCS